MQFVLTALFSLLATLIDSLCFDILTQSTPFTLIFISVFSSLMGGLFHYQSLRFFIFKDQSNSWLVSYFDYLQVSILCLISNYIITSLLMKFIAEFLDPFFLRLISASLSFLIVTYPGLKLKVFTATFDREPSLEESSKSSYLKR